MFFGLGPKGVPKAAQGGPKGSSEGPKGVPSKAKVSSGGSHRGPKGVPKGVQGRPKDYKNRGEMGSLRNPCKKLATARKTVGKP